jgi:CDP-diacylglycerol--glycerol-3-phosphate 3-phosphatidyltransferase
LNVAPNTVTLAGCAISVLGGALAAVGRWQASAMVIALAGFIDGMDGLLARIAQQTTPFGAFLDSVLDRWSDSAFFVGLLVWHGRAGMETEQILCVVALSSSLLVSYTRARAEGIGAECRRGLFTRLERVITLVAGLLLGQVTVALWVIAVLSTFTALQRIYYTWQYARAKLPG